MRFGKSVGWSVWSLAAVLAIGSAGCTIEARMGSGPVEPINWQSSSNPRPNVPAPAPMPNVPPPQPQPQPQPAQPGPRKIGRIPKPAPTGGTTMIPVPIARNNGLFGGSNEHAALKGIVYFIPETTMTFPDVSNMKPSALVYTDTLNIEMRDFTEGVAGTNRLEFYAIEYTGTFNVAKGGNFTFSLASSDGSKLYIDDKLVIDNDGRHTPQHREGVVNLAAGQHSIKVDFFKAYRWVIQLQLFVTPEGGTSRVWTKDL